MTLARQRSRRYALRLAVLGIVGGLMLWLGNALLGGPRLATGWHYEVVANHLTDVSALAFDAAGHLYATLERHHGRGEVVRIGPDGNESVITGLDKPDGILLLDEALYVTNEGGPQGLVVYRAGEQRSLDGIANAEGISATRDGKILIIEDRKHDGRLLRFDPASSAIEVLAAGLEQSEGVCQAPNGDIFIVEKAANRLSRYTGGGTGTLATGLHKPAYLGCLADGSLLITEDRTNLGRLLRYRDGRIEVLARSLRAPQGVIRGPDGAYYLAEQGRGRILRIHAS